VEVEGVVAHSIGGDAVILAFSHLRNLAIDTGLHDFVFADSAVVFSIIGLLHFTQSTLELERVRVITNRHIPKL